MATDPPLPWFTGTFRDRLISFVRRARPNIPKGDIEDALQDVLLRIQERVSASAPPQAPCDWDRYMYQAVSNRLNDMHHSAGRRVPLDEGHLEREASAETEQPELSLEHAERATLFHVLIQIIRGDSAKPDHTLGRVFTALQQELQARLQDRHWIVLRMRGIEGMGFQETAQALGVSLGSAHGLYRAALDICAAVLRRHGLGPEFP